MSGRLKRWLGLRPEMAWSFYVTDFFFRKLLRRNARSPWAVHHTATIHAPQRLSVGKGTFPGDSPGVFIDAKHGIEIGDYTEVGPNVGIISYNHDLIDKQMALAGAPVHIGHHCWLGMGAIVLPGVVLGDFTVVGAGAVVTKSFPDGYCVVAGNPARLVRALDKDACTRHAALRRHGA